MQLEAPPGGAEGFSILFVDAMHYNNYAARLSHSCDPNVEVSLRAIDGEYCINFYAKKDVQPEAKALLQLHQLHRLDEEVEARFACAAPSDVTSRSWASRATTTSCVDATDSSSDKPRSLAAGELFAQWHAALERGWLKKAVCSATRRRGSRTSSATSRASCAANSRGCRIRGTPVRRAGMSADKLDPPSFGLVQSGGGDQATTWRENAAEHGHPADGALPPRARCERERRSPTHRRLSLVAMDANALAWTIVVVILTALLEPCSESRRVLTPKNPPRHGEGQSREGAFVSRSRNRWRERCAGARARHMPSPTRRTTRRTSSTSGCSLRWGFTEPITSVSSSSSDNKLFVVVAGSIRVDAGPGQARRRATRRRGAANVARTTRRCSPSRRTAPTSSPAPRAGARAARVHVENEVPPVSARRARPKRSCRVWSALDADGGDAARRQRPLHRHRRRSGATCTSSCGASSRECLCTRAYNSRRDFLRGDCPSTRGSSRWAAAMSDVKVPMNDGKGRWRATPHGSPMTCTPAAGVHLGRLSGRLHAGGGRTRRRQPGRTPPCSRRLDENRKKEVNERERERRE